MNNLPPAPLDGPGFQLASPVDVTAAPPAPKFRPKKFLLALRKFWWIPLITLILAVGAALVNFRTSPPQFVSYGGMLEPEQLQLASGANFTEDQDTFFGNLTAVLQNDTLKQLALQRLETAGTNNVARDQDGNPIPVQISVFQQPKSTVFTVQATGSNPAFTQAYLNALMDSFLDFKKTSRQGVSEVTLDSLATELERHEQDMNSDQAVLSEFERSNNFAVLQQENEIGGAYLAKLKTQLADLQLQDRLLSAVALEKVSHASLDFTNAPTMLFNAVLDNNSSQLPPSQGFQGASQQLTSLKFQYDQLGKYLRPGHPKMVKLNQQIELAQNLIDASRMEDNKEIAMDGQALQIRMTNVEQTISEWEDKVSKSGAILAQAENLRSKISRDQSLYERLTSLSQNVDLTRDIDQETIAILQRATAAKRSYSKFQSDLSMAVVGGLAAGLGIILLLAIRDDRFASVVEATEIVGDGIVGQVPEVTELPDGKHPALLEINDDRHMYVESYRNLRSALLFLAVDGVRPKVLLITSAVPNEGKSTIASNLSCALAMGGARVMLVDGDLRKGRLHDVMGLSPKPGLAEFLRQPEDLDKFIQTSRTPNLSFLSRGGIQRNPGDLFLSPAFDHLLVQLRERFDYVIIDSSPVFAADDATTLAPKTDGTLFVMRSRFSRANLVKQALEQLYQRQATVLGLVLNRTDATDRSYHYYKYAEYYSTVET